MDTKPGAREVAEFATSDANPASARLCYLSTAEAGRVGGRGNRPGRACLLVPCFWLQLWFYGHIDSEGL